MCLTAATREGLALDDVPDKLRDLEMCVAAVSKNGWALLFILGVLCDREMCVLRHRNSRELHVAMCSC